MIAYSAHFGRQEGASGLPWLAVLPTPSIVRTWSSLRALARIRSRTTGWPARGLCRRMQDADDRRKRLKAMRAEASAGGVEVEAALGAGGPIHTRTSRLACRLASAVL